MSDEIVIKIEINDKVYPVSCKLGEEERVKTSAKLVSETIKDLGHSSNSASENRLLVMSSLILADKITTSKKTTNNGTLGQKNIEELLDWLDDATSRLNKVATLFDES